jgi:site-specific DNA recombinase
VTFRWVGLVRVDHAGKVDKAQEDALRRFAAGHGELVGIVADTIGQPGEYVEYVGMAQALLVLDANEADGLLVDRLDRFDVYLREIVLHEVRMRGCVLASCRPGDQAVIDAPPDYEIEVLREFLGFYKGFAQVYPMARTQAGRRRKRATDGWAGGLAPYGYELNGHGSLREVAHEMHAIAVIRTMRRLGATYPMIGQYLADSGVRLRRGAAWAPATVVKILDRAEEQGRPRPEPLDNLAKLIMGLPADARAI